jgi:hypothetical protein
VAGGSSIPVIPRAQIDHWGEAGLVSGDDLADWLAVVDLQPLTAGDLEPAGVEAELVEDRRVDVLSDRGDSVDSPRLRIGTTRRVGTALN